jgi:tetratricopeptide (TPR) repeat protein
LVEPLSDTDVADNIVFALADLAEHDFENDKDALRYHDHLVKHYEDSGLIDDSLWHGARLARATGDPEGAAARLRKLLSRREVAFGAGSYFSVWLDDANLELGRILRKDLARYDEAIKVLGKLPEDYPDSTLHDDALFESALSYSESGRHSQACERLAELRKRFPDSKYNLEKAPAAAAKLGCADAKP